MVDCLRNVIDSIEKLPPERQEQLAKHLEELLEEQEWDTFISSEHGMQLIADILANHERE